MAKNNIEIEIKIKLTSEELERVKKLLIQRSNEHTVTKHIDRYFTPKHENYLDNKYPFKWLSIRERGSKAIINMKHFYPEHQPSHDYCKEFETEVKDINSIISIFNELEMTEVIQINKTRESFLIEDKFEVSLDIVNELGNFLEIESIKESESIDETKKQLLQYLNSLGIENPNIDNSGYPFLLLNHNLKIMLKTSNND